MKSLNKLLIVFLALMISFSALLTSCNFVDEYVGKIKNEKKDNSDEVETYNHVALLPIYIEGESVIADFVYDNEGRFIAVYLTALGGFNKAALGVTYDDSGKAAKFFVQSSYGFPMIENKLTFVEGTSRAVGIAVEYHDDGSIDRIAEPSLTAFDFDESGRIKSIDEEITFSYEDDSMLPNSYLTKEGRCDIIYDANGYVTALNCSNGHSLSYIYDQNGNIVKEIINLSEGTKTRVCEYDAKNNLTKITATKFVNSSTKTETFLQYNSQDLLTTLKCVEYDSNNDIVEETVITLGYDNKNRIKKKMAQNYTDGAVSEYEYDLYGNITGMVVLDYDSNHNLVYKSVVEIMYDSFGRPIEESEVVYHLDELDMKYGVTYEYDDMFRVIVETRIRYDDNGIYNGKIVYNYSYDAEGKRMTSYTSYDKDGNATGNGSYR